MNFVERWFAGRGVRQILEGRLRSSHQPRKGRLTAADMNAIVDSTWRHYDALSPAAPVLLTRGNRTLMRGGVFSLALYRALCEAVEEREQATQLAGDVLWKAYAQSMKWPARWARLIHRDRKKQLKYLCGLGTRYRYSPPGYEVQTRFEGDTFFMSFTRCPICDYFRDQGEEELQFFRNTWCNMDWAVIELMVKGPVSYERTLTLSEGDDLCDMKWIVCD